VKLVTIVRPPERPEEAAKALAGAAGLTLAEARMRLAPEPPALLVRAEAERAEEITAALLSSGLAALAVDVEVPSDKDRTTAHEIVFTDADATFVPRAGLPMKVAWPEVLAIFPGMRSARSETERTEKSKKLSLGMAVMTGGLKMTRTSEKSVRSSEESNEQVILVYARNGRCAVISESDIDFSCLGSALQPSSTANMLALARRLREKAGKAFYDDRLLRLGRRPLPLIAGFESRTQTAAVAAKRTDTRGSLDLLAEVMRKALVEGLLP
jgi:hypothetical protein